MKLFQRECLPNSKQYVCTTELQLLICLLPLDIPAKGTVLIVPQSHFGDVQHRKKGKLEDNISVSDRDDKLCYKYNGDESAN